MPAYAHITQFLPDFESLSGENLEQLVYQQFIPTCSKLSIMDPDYYAILENCGLTGDKLLHANIEALDLHATVALLGSVLLAGQVYDGAPLTAAESGYIPRILRRIAELDGTWKRPNVVTFYHEYEEDGYLSNWFASPFTFRGTTFPTSEHWMMWQKACVFRDWDVAGKILQVPSTNPGKVKWLGGKESLKGFVQSVWDDMDQQLMRVGLRQKFVQNERLLNGLLSTGSAVLGEAAGTKDTKWGVGFDKSSPKLADPANWYGKSLLGRTLAEVRGDLRSLCALDGRLEWSEEDLLHSQVWRMNLLELTRVPSTRPMARAYATIVAQSDPSTFHGASDVLRQVRDRICDIHVMMTTNMGGGLPVTGWYELLDELALQVRLGRL